MPGVGGTRGALTPIAGAAPARGRLAEPIPSSRSRAIILSHFTKITKPPMQNYAIGGGKLGGNSQIRRCAQAGVAPLLAHGGTSSALPSLAMNCLIEPLGAGSNQGLLLSASFPRLSDERLPWKDNIIPNPEILFLNLCKYK